MSNGMMILQVILIILRLIGILNCSWFIVFLPVLLPFIVFFGFGALLLLFLIIVIGWAFLMSLFN